MFSDTFASFLLGLVPSAIAVVALYIEGRRNRIALQTELLLNLNEQMNSMEMKRLRRKVAKNLIAKRKPNYELGELLDFYSMVCYLYRCKATNTDLLYNQFGWWIIRYWLCSKEWILNVRIDVDPDGWRNLESVANEFLIRDAKDGHPQPSENMLKRFLELETSLFFPGR